ncbi:50S ribosomal protein L6 [Thermus filiformis]|uniref:Large ribosomal subunit protein uL6 n=1 Tax=Thermus filiformis TaxID=276 RepID=A0A0A2WV93_THEFI|nr:50S ribosomal protein L6 [Thermus filiformis]KGQ22672.1 50S ribosomal protein L6 [Thermus filiformis]
MSRIGRQPIPLPKGVTVEVAPGQVKVKGPKGELFVPVSPEMRIVVEEGLVRVERPSDDRRHKSLHGLTRTLIANAVKGVSEGYVRELLIKGIGYRAKLSGRAVELTVGYSHPVVVEPPAGITFEVPEPTKIRVLGIDKQLVGQVAANLRAVRKPSAYHEKGIYYADEPIRLKPGKAGAKK